MSRKSLFEILAAIGLLVVFVLAVRLGANTSAIPSTDAAALNPGRLAGSDWVERHPVAGRLNYFIGSDWIERNPSRYYTGSDFFERHRPAVKAVNYTGSDYFERHQPAVKVVNYAAQTGSSGTLRTTMMDPITSSATRISQLAERPNKWLKT